MEILLQIERPGYESITWTLSATGPDGFGEVVLTLESCRELVRDEDCMYDYL